MGNLYNYISGSNGTRIIFFFKYLSINLVEAYIKSFKFSLIIILAAILNAILTVIYKLLKKVPRVNFNHDLLNLINSLKNIPKIIDINYKSATF